MTATYLRYTQEPDNNAKCYHCYYFLIKIHLPLSNILVLYVSYRKIETAFSPLCRVFNPSDKWKFLWRTLTLFSVCCSRGAIEWYPENDGKLSDDKEGATNYWSSKMWRHKGQENICQTSRDDWWIPATTFGPHSQQTFFLKINREARPTQEHSAATTRALHNTWAPDQTKDPGSVVTFH